jgi:hypothetical protein
MTIFFDSTPLINTKFIDTMQKMNDTYETTKDSLTAIESYLTGLQPMEIYPVFNRPDFVRYVLTKGERPAAPNVNFPDLPIESVDVAIPGFNYSDSPYGSELREALKARLTDGVENGGTGLGAEVEDALWTRNQDRDEQARQDRIDAVSAEWAESGFELPDGVLAAQSTAVDVEFLQGRQTASKDIAIKQAELARIQSESYLKEGNQLEATMEGKHTADQARSLEAAKVEPEIVIRSIEARLAKIKVVGEIYNALAAKANAQAQVFKSEMDGWVGEATVGAQELESSTKVYNADIQGAAAQSESAYKTDANRIEQIKNYLLLRMEGLKTISQLAAQMTAALATSVSTSASVSSGSQTSQSESDSTSISHIYEHKDDREYL